MNLEAEILSNAYKFFKEVLLDTRQRLLSEGNSPEKYDRSLEELGNKCKRACSMLLSQGLIRTLLFAFSKAKSMLFRGAQKPKNRDELLKQLKDSLLKKVEKSKELDEASQWECICAYLIWAPMWTHIGNLLDVAEILRDFSNLGAQYPEMLLQTETLCIEYLNILARLLEAEVG
ncbi:MAG: hypothetical protein ACTSXJ_09515 [Candidatus Baldrarchaeia archaeon]